VDYARNLSNLTSFLHATNPSSDSFSRFLVLNTFSGFAPTALILGVLQPDGSMIISGSFGIGEKIKDLVLNVAARSNSPFHEAMQKDKIISITGIETSQTNSRNEKEAELFLEGFEYALAWPIYYVGVGILCFEKKFVMSQLDELFFRAVGGMLAIHHTCRSTLSNFDEAVGAVGPAGPPGIRGAIGETGATGIEGAIGATGIAGEKGAIGATGATGLAGAKGNVGDKGDTGLQGLAWTQKDHSSQLSSTQSTELTSRQLVILAELRRGKTNMTIATDLNYSQSLIRQETIEIYHKMGISGRKELVEKEVLEKNEFS
jgi:DNA-binding CsgD family transcriptional regulator